MVLVFFCRILPGVIGMSKKKELASAIESIQRLSELARETGEALNRLSSECTSKTIGDLLERTSCGFSEYNSMQGEMLDEMEHYQSVSNAALNVASSDFVNCHDDFQAQMDRFKSDPTPENQRCAHEKKMQWRGVTRR